MIIKKDWAFQLLFISIKYCHIDETHINNYFKLIEKYGLKNCEKLIELKIIYKIKIKSKIQ